MGGCGRGVGISAAGYRLPRSGLVQGHLCFLRPTGDIDVVDVTPPQAKPWLAVTAGQGSALHRRHEVYLQFVTVATMPYHYEERTREIFAGQLERLGLTAHAQRFLSVHGVVLNLFRVGRHRLRAVHHSPAPASVTARPQQATDLCSQSS